MLKEISRSFDAAHRAIRVRVEDDFGVKSELLFHVANHSCYACGRAMPTHGDGTIDVDAAVKQASDEHDLETEKMIACFERHGADMKAVREKRQAIKADLSNNVKWHSLS